MLRKICIAAFFLKAMMQDIDTAQILGPKRRAVCTAAQPMPQANMAAHRVGCKHKTPGKSFGVGLTYPGRRSLKHLKWSCCSVARLQHLPLRCWYPWKPACSVELSVNCQGMVAAIGFIRAIKIPGAITTLGNGRVLSNINPKNKQDF